VREEGKILEDHADPATRGIDRCDIIAAYEHATGVVRVKTGHDLEQCALAGICRP